MMRVLDIPAHVTVEGIDWTVQRVWPSRSSDGSLPIEARSSDGLRGGRWHPTQGVSLLEAGADRRLPALGALVATGELVSHRPGKRAVVRLHDGSGYAKVVAPGRASRVIDGHERGAGFARHFRVAEVITDDDSRAAGAIRFTTVPGRTVAELGEDARTSMEDWARMWQAWADRWVSTLTSDHDGSGPGDDTAVGTHTASDEAAIIRSWADHAAAAGVDRARRIRAVAARLSDELLRLGPVRPVLSHRDLHDKQILWSADGGLGLLDLDTSTRADAALDLGNLAAHADLAGRQGRWTGERVDVVVDAVHRAAAALDVDPERLDVWRRASRFRIDCVHLLRPRWRDIALHDLNRRLTATPDRRDHA